jgi:MOSC domain-containing protein YiiM
MRQVHLIHAELFDDLTETGFHVTLGDLGENITMRGIDLLGLPVGTRLTIGRAVIAVTGLRNPCQQINNFQQRLLEEVVHTEDHGQVVLLAGIMGIVSRTGRVNAGDRVDVDLPPKPHHPLTRV